MCSTCVHVRWRKVRLFRKKWKKNWSGIVVHTAGHPSFRTHVTRGNSGPDAVEDPENRPACGCCLLGQTAGRMLSRSCGCGRSSTYKNTSASPAEDYCGGNGGNDSNQMVASTSPLLVILIMVAHRVCRVCSVCFFFLRAGSSGSPQRIMYTTRLMHAQRTHLLC